MLKVGYLVQKGASWPSKHKTRTRNTHMPTPRAMTAALQSHVACANLRLGLAHRVRIITDIGTAFMTTGTSIDMHIFVQGVLPALERVCAAMPRGPFLRCAVHRFPVRPQGQCMALSCIHMRPCDATDCTTASLRRRHCASCSRSFCPRHCKTVLPVATHAPVVETGPRLRRSLRVLPPPIPLSLVSCIRKAGPYNAPPPPGIRMRHTGRRWAGGGGRHVGRNSVQLSERVPFWRCRPFCMTTLICWRFVGASCVVVVDRRHFGNAHPPDVPPPPLPLVPSRSAWRDKGHPPRFTVTPPPRPP